MKKLILVAFVFMSLNASDRDCCLPDEPISGFYYNLLPKYFLYELPKLIDKADNLSLTDKSDLRALHLITSKIKNLDIPNKDDFNILWRMIDVNSNFLKEEDLHALRRLAAIVNELSSYKFGRTHFAPRSQGHNVARHMIGIDLTSYLAARKLFNNSDDIPEYQKPPASLEERFKYWESLYRTCDFDSLPDAPAANRNDSQERLSRMFEQFRLEFLKKEENNSNKEND